MLLQELATTETSSVDWDAWDAELAAQFNAGEFDDAIEAVEQEIALVAEGVGTLADLEDL